LIPSAVHINSFTYDVMNADEIDIMYCRALYDYTSRGPNELTFRRNDVIEVFGRSQNGWWDGLVRDVRGWFPSNYVVLITERDAMEELARVRN